MTGASCLPALKAMSDENRLRILRLLDPLPLSVNEISTRLGVSQYNASKHLRILREAGLLECRKQGRQRLYSIPGPLLATTREGHGVLDLGCCSFQLDQLAQ